MSERNFIKTLKQTLNKLKEDNSQLLKEMESIQPDKEKDPEKSPVHDLWHTYRVQSEFKDFIEGLLQRRYYTNTA